jgi:hypothetical protein
MVNRDDYDNTVVGGMFAIADAIQYLARALDRLGNADAATQMGAIEALGKHLGEALDGIACAIDNHDGHDE